MELQMVTLIKATSLTLMSNIKPSGRLIFSVCSILIRSFSGIRPIAAVISLAILNVSVLDNSYNTVWTKHFFTDGGHPALSLTIDLPDNSLREIVKVRLNGSNYLSLAKVQVFGGTPVPEPTTMLLLGCGLIGLAAYGRKKFFKK